MASHLKKQGNRGHGEGGIEGEGVGSPTHQGEDRKEFRTVHGPRTVEESFVILRS